MILRDIRRIGALAATLLLVCLGAWHPLDARADGVTASATLILASDAGNGSDARLSALEPKLRRLFKFKNYQFRGSGSASMAVPGKGNIGLPDNCRISLTVSDAGEGRLRVEVRWNRGNQMVVNTTVVNRRGDPIILGGPSLDSGTLIVAITLH